MGRPKRVANNSVNRHLGWNIVRRLENLAKAGSSQGSSSTITIKGEKMGMSASEFLFSYNRQLARESNWRLRKLYKGDYKHFATEKAYAFTSTYFHTKYYKEDLTDLDMIRKQILSMERFLGYQTSTVEGYERVLDNRIETARANWFSDRPEVTDEQIKEFLRFLGSDSVSYLMDTVASKSMGADYFTSEDIAEDLQELWMDSTEDLRNELRSEIEKLQYAEQLQASGITQYDDPNADYYRDDLFRYFDSKMKQKRGLPTKGKKKSTGAVSRSLKKLY